MERFHNQVAAKALKIITTVQEKGFGAILEDEK